MTEAPDSPLRLVECPIFDDLDRVSVAFACELTTSKGAAAPETGYRLTEIHRELFGPAHQRLTSTPAGDALARARKLFDASRSFLDDITTGPPGANGRPMLISAALDEDGWSGLRARIVRPASWRYEFENAEVELGVPADQRIIDVTFNDQFCIFESGRIFYLGMFGQDAQSQPRLNEYALIQLERLIIDPQDAASAARLGFVLAGATGDGVAPEAISLREFLARRLADLAAAPSPEPNAVRDVLLPFGIIDEGAELRLLERGWLKNGLVQIEDEELLFAARYANEHYCLESPAADKSADLPDRAAAIARWDARWRKHHLERAGSGLSRPHHAPAFKTASASSAMEAEIVPRPLLAFAGLAQGIPDFPRQDDSEVHDSTRPATAATEGMFYVHPAFELAIGVNWRTFSDGQRSVGGCPYAILAWIIGLHDEVIVADMERRIEAMIYGVPAGKTSAHALGRAQPAGDLMTILRGVSSILPSRRTLMDDNLRARLDIFRWCSIQRSGNVFRYPTERELLDAIRTARGTDARFDAAHMVVDRYESLVEDLSSLATGYKASRAGFLLAAIAALGLIGLPQALVEAGSLFGWRVDPIQAIMLIVAAVAILFALWVQPPSRPGGPRLFSSADRENPRK